MPVKNKGKSTPAPAPAPQQNVDQSALINQAIQAAIQAGQQGVTNAFAAGYGSNGGGGGGANYFDPGPYLPPIYTGPSPDEINAKWGQFGLEGQGIDLSNQKNSQDYQNALAALGLQGKAATQTAGYQTGKLNQGAAYQRQTLGVNLDQQLQGLLSQATGNGAITSKGYGQNVGWANQQNQYDLNNISTNLQGDLGNVQNTLQNALAGNQLGYTQAGQALQQSQASNANQLALINNQKQQYDTGNASGVNQYGQRVGQYNTNYGYVPYGQTAVGGQPITPYQQPAYMGTQPPNLQQSLSPPPQQSAYNQSGGQKPTFYAQAGL